MKKKPEYTNPGVVCLWMTYLLLREETTGDKTYTTSQHKSYPQARTKNDPVVVHHQLRY